MFFLPPRDPLVPQTSRTKLPHTLPTKLSVFFTVLSFSRRHQHVRSTSPATNNKLKPTPSPQFFFKSPELINDSVTDDPASRIP
jgi:hypothetical protein